MSLAAAHRAIIARWDAQGLDAAIPGGLHEGTAPEGARTPYGVLTLIGSAVGPSIEPNFP